ncbi:MAG: proton-conducting transporter membrane subunit [Hyphomonas sp.]
MSISLIYASLAAPALLSVYACIALASGALRPKVRIIGAWFWVILLAAATALAVSLARDGVQTLNLGIISIRVDLVSVVLFGLVSFIGGLVLKFSVRYLDGEARQGPFFGWMALTLASVLMLVMSGSLWQLVAAWIATSLFLDRLLKFYSGRAGALRAARKKFFLARIGDAALLAAVTCLWAAFGTADIAAINLAARDGGSSIWTSLAAATLAISALIKSAQFPVHGWLTEVMEAPTPVSALLHAGVINAGGFLLIRFADVMLLAPGALALLVMVGGFTALFGGLVMLTQPAVKTSLAWSTIAQMGFMMLQCGLALFPMALLHIVAHSLYKAHAFLSSGNAVNKIAEARRPGPVAVPGVGAVALAFVCALALYAATGFLFGFESESPQAIALGAILIFGIAYLLAQGFADRAPRALTAYTAAYAVAATLAYFTLQRGAEHLMKGTLPAAPIPGPLEWALMCLALISFGLTAFAQSTFPLWSGHPAVRGLRVHLLNGFYANALMDRWLNNWSHEPARRLSTTHPKGPAQ